MSGVNIHIEEKIWTGSASGAHHAIAQLQLKLEDHQFVCLLGPSGCGKTTLLNMIAGLDRHFQGRIDIAQASQRDARIGYVFQNPRLLPWLTVRENIEVVFEAAPPAALIDTLLTVIQLQDKQQAYPQHLSLGMQRRVAIIRAFAINPDLLLMDEPFVSLDAANARQIRDLLYGLWQQRPHTVLLVSHDLRESVALADRLIFLSRPPMRIVNDVRVDIPRHQRNDPAKIEAFLARLPALQCTDGIIP